MKLPYFRSFKISFIYILISVTECIIYIKNFQGITFIQMKGNNLLPREEKLFPFYVKENEKKEHIFQFFLLRGSLCFRALFSK